MQRRDEQRGEIRKHSVAPRNQRDCTLKRTKKGAKKSHRSPFSIRFVPARSSHCQRKLASRRSGRSCALRGAQGSIRGTLAHEESALGHKGPGEGSQGFPPTHGNQREQLGNQREPVLRSHPAWIQFPVLPPILVTRLSRGVCPLVGTRGIPCGKYSSVLAMDLQKHSERFWCVK